MTKKLYILLLFSIVSITLFFYGFYFTGSTNEKTSLSNLESIKGIIEKKIQNLEVNAHLIKDQWANKERNKTFGDFLKVTEGFLAYEFIQNGQLKFWNNNLVSIHYDSSFIHQNNSIIKLNNGYYYKWIFKNEKQEDTSVLVLLYLVKKDYKIENKIFTNELNPVIFPDGNYQIIFEPVPSSQIFTSVKSSSYKTLFNLVYTSATKDGLKVLLLVTSGLSGILFFLWFLLVICNNLKFRSDKKYFILGIVILSIGVLIIKYFSTHYLSPFLMNETILFDPTYFAISDFLPSLGDVLITLILSFILFFFLIPTTDYRLPTTDYRLPITDYRLPLTVFLLFIFLSAVLLCLYLIWEIYKNRISGFIISHDNNFSLFQFYSLALIGLLFYLLFLLLQKIFIFADAVFKRYFLKDRHLPLLFILLLIVISLITSLIIGKTYQYDTQNRMKILSQNIMTGNDVLAEYYLNIIRDKTTNDPFIQTRFLRPSVNEEFIQKKIKQVYINRYFDKYDVSVEVYKINGMREGNLSTDNYFELEKEAIRLWIKTEYKDQYFRQFSENGVLKEYLQFIPISTKGYILVRLLMNRTQSASLLPKLLIDQKYYKSLNNDDFNFAVFSDGKQIFSNSDINYERIEKVRNYFPFNQNEMYFSTEGFTHFVQPFSQNKFIIISTAKFKGVDYFSNFCYCFFVFGLFILFYWLIFSLLIETEISRSSLRLFSLLKFRSSFAYKIQYFIGLVSVLPLLVVIGVSIFILVWRNEENQINKSIDKAHGVKNIVTVYFNEYKQHKINNENFEKLLKDYSTIISYDITIYNENGKILFTTQPTVYDFGLKARLLEPKALQQLIELKDRVLYQHEKIGNIEYSSVYMKMGSFDNQKLSGILNLQYLESEKELIKDVRDLISAILNVYVPVIILFVILSLFFSNSFLVPLEMLSEKLRTLSFSTIAPALEWKSNDEIGVLVKHYNSMLLKLEESRKLIARSERESAWREIAQKVAHEIKNPLTPMKLTLQHLDRALKDKHPKTDEMTKKAIVNLIEQIEILNQIASSFSTYAKMPQPIMRELDIVEILTKQVHIFQQSAQATFELNLNGNLNLFIYADEMELSRVFSNLIINAIQAVSDDKKPLINIFVKTENQKVHIEIKDNGLGIPEDIRDSVFLPRFSTKKTGSGLGLALCKKSIEDFGGRIWFETEINKGTTFFIELSVIKQHNFSLLSAYKSKRVN